jgi:hypothetical protein
MRVPTRISVLFFIGIFAAGSTALGYYYYYVWSPPLRAAEQFMRAMESGDVQAVRRSIVVTDNVDTADVREATDDDAQFLVAEHFQRGRILDQRKREGKTRDYDYLVYREPDGQIYALLVTKFGEDYRVVIPERRQSTRERYLWEYTWTN